ncbi:unnamed protein product [Porites evermanni]|uniref:Uncharacterized protein n=1 Tax=Porites evermanni TaxID=104178 RepID=A0ABN8T3Z6_9CNID|nr:unnamed protein product [Porites evermanni]
MPCNQKKCCYNETEMNGTSKLSLFCSYLMRRAFHKFHSLRTASNVILASLFIADGLLTIPSVVDILHLNLFLRDELSLVLHSEKHKLTFQIPSPFSCHSSPRLNQFGTVHRREVLLMIPHHSNRSPRTDRFYRHVAVGCRRYDRFPTGT